VVRCCGFCGTSEGVSHVRGDANKKSRDTPGSVEKSRDVPGLGGPAVRGGDLRGRRVRRWTGQQLPADDPHLWRGMNTQPYLAAVHRGNDHGHAFADVDGFACAAGEFQLGALLAL
jgi:hypothetical protein